MRLARVFQIVELGLRLTLVRWTMAAQEAEKVRGRPTIPTPIKITIPAFPDGVTHPAQI